MGYIIINKDDEEMDGLRTQMRRRYRGGSYRTYPMMRGGESSMREHYYKKGYEHAMEDMEDDDMEMRRRRNSRGEFI